MFPLVVFISSGVGFSYFMWIEKILESIVPSIPFLRAVQITVTSFGLKKYRNHPFPLVIFGGEDNSYFISGNILLSIYSPITIKETNKMRMNKKIVNNVRTHEGAVASRINPVQQLRRSIMSCMLWENEFYEDGEHIADRIKSLVKMVDPIVVADTAVVAREFMHLRHTPLFLAHCLDSIKPNKHVVAPLLEKIIMRPDELSEFLAMHWSAGKRPISAQAKKGLARAFQKFNEYQLAKWDNKKREVKLRDVMRMVHPVPKDKEQAEMWGKLLNGTLTTPDTWEVAISAAAGNPNETRKAWERLVMEKKLGGLAVLRNLRNMQQAGLSEKLIRSAINNMNADKVLPFRFIAASRYAPGFEAELERKMFSSMNGVKLPGKTVVLVDVSGSMSWALSAKSDMLRMDAANGLAMILREISDDIEIYSFSNQVVRVPSRRGFALHDAIRASQKNVGTHLGMAVRHVVDNVEADRLIVITDEQTGDTVIDKGIPDKSYMINVASARNGVGYGKWRHIDGFSEAIVYWILAYENQK